MDVTMRLRFGSCTLDVDARRLFRGENEVHLSPKAFETLRVLVESRPRAVSKAELHARVWPDVFVGDVSLARAINEIRQALGDDRHGRIIRTVHSHGYAFVGEVGSFKPSVKDDWEAPRGMVDLFDAFVAAV
jgi:DNA-binding winged helix-turn-helix (wHTH) protein